MHDVVDLILRFETPAQECGINILWSGPIRAGPPFFDIIPLLCTMELHCDTIAFWRWSKRCYDFNCGAAVFVFSRHDGDRFPDANQVGPPIPLSLAL